MQIGLCTDITNARLAKEAGFDYIEPALNKLGTMSEEDFLASVKAKEEAGIPVKSTAIMFPKTMMVIGEDSNRDEMCAYLNTAFSRMAKLGGTIAVFGSGKSRRIPAGYNYQKSFAELVEVTRLVVSIASKYGITVVIEPLNQNETDLINSLKEGAALSALTGAALLADSFHMAKENEGWHIIKEVSPLLHAHIATKDGRRYPTEDSEEVRGFLNALKESNYSGNLSIEGKTEDIVGDGKRAIAVIKGIMES